MVFCPQPYKDEDLVEVYSLVTVSPHPRLEWSPNNEMNSTDNDKFATFSSPSAEYFQLA